MLMLLASLLACSAPDVTAEFESRKTAALGPPSKMDASWDEEVVLRLGQALVSQLVIASVNAELEGAEPVDVGTFGKLKINAKLKSMDLIKPGCDACVGIRGTLGGTVKFKVKGLKAKTVDLTVKFKGQLEFASKDAGPRGRHLTMTLNDIQDVEVSTGRTNTDVGDVLGEHTTRMLERVETVDLGPIGSSDLPLRDVRLIGSKDGLRIEAMASCVQAAPTSGLPSWDGEGFQVLVSEGVLLDTARKEAFRTGDISGEHALNIWAEPTSLNLEGSEFSMGLRLWRLEGTGWWRDYTLTGPVTLERGHLTLEADALEEGDRSEGAALVDPLSWMGEWLILDTMADAARGAFPARDAFQMGDLRLTTTLESLDGSNDALVLDGKLAVHGGKKSK